MVSFDFKGAVDRGMHCIYKHDLPRINKEIKPFLSTHKTATRLNDRSCDVIRMAVNQNILALLGTFWKMGVAEFRHRLRGAVAKTQWTVSLVITGIY